MQLITVEEVKARLDNGEKLNLLDVRQPSENAEFNIGGILFPLGKVQAMDIGEIENLKDKRSSAIAEAATEADKPAIFWTC